MPSLWSVLRWLVVLGAVALTGTAAVAQPDSRARRFGAANEAYAEGRYADAVQTYRALLAEGHASGALYHNLGNAYVRLDSVGPAIWAYEKARQLRPNDPRLRHNLDYVRRGAGLPEIGLPPRGLAALVAGWPPLLLFIVGVLALSVGALGAVGRGDPGQWFAWRAPLAWGPLVAGGVLVVVALGTSYVQAQDRRAVVTAETASLRAAPSTTAVSDSTLRGGTMVELRTTAEQQWRRVRLGDGTVGWLPVRALREI